MTLAKQRLRTRAASLLAETPSRQAIVVAIVGKSRPVDGRERVLVAYTAEGVPASVIALNLRELADAIDEAVA